MNIVILSIGKKHEEIFEAAILEFSSRIERHSSLEWKFLPPDGQSDLNKEAELILEAIKPGDFVVALDEKGKEVTSMQLSDFLQKRLNESIKRIVFVIGGAYGLGLAVKERANAMIALSQLTFPHQLVRLVLAEQLYRAFSILRGEKYHHQ